MAEYPKWEPHPDRKPEFLQRLAALLWAGKGNYADNPAGWKRCRDMAITAVVKSWELPSDG